MKYGEPWEHNGNAGHVRVSPHYATCVFVAEGRTREQAREAAARIVACVNACAGIDDPAEALRAAREALDFYACIDHYPGGCADDVAMRDSGERARDALRLLKP